MRIAALLLFFSVFMTNAVANPHVLLETSEGEIAIELYADEAPASVENFLGYVRDGHYDGTVFHRVIDGFMIQGGGFTPDLSQKPTGQPIENEADNGLSNERGTVAMARTSDPHSATAQFFINLVNNTRLDHVSPASGRTWGYAVFGRVVEGMAVVDAIGAVPTVASGGHQNVPADPVIVERARLLEGGAGTAQ